MNKKSIFSAAGLVAIAIALVVSVALISALPSLRIDLTEDNLYTLSDGTRNIVSGLEEPLEILFFYSESGIEDAPFLRSYADRIQELLREIVLASDDNLRFEVIDPEPFSESEDLATQYGLDARPLTQGGTPVYLGLVVRRQSASENPLQAQIFETMPLIRPDQEEYLEYEFLKLITRVEDPELDVVGLITGLDIDGGFDPLAGQATSPWIIMEYVRQLYEVRRLSEDVTEIEEDVDILMLIHPEGLSEETLYAIDQHVMRGGEVLLFLDPNADSMVSRSQQGNLVPAGMSSDLPRLLLSWGVDYDSNQVLTDGDLALRVRMGQAQRPQPHLGMLGIDRDHINQGDIITRGLESLNLSSAGAVAKLDDAGTEFEALIESSTNAMLMSRSILEDIMDPSVLFDEFESSNQSYVLGARISGMLESAFPEGRPVDEIEPEAAESTEDGVSDNPAQPEQEVVANDEEADAEPEPETAPHVASSQEMASILIFTDTDMLSDRLWVQVAQFMGQRIPQPFANNGDLVINALDNLSGGADLVSIRSRGRYSRPFTRVLDLQREADDRLRIEEAELLDRVAETEASLAELNQTEDGQPLGQLTPEIQAEIDRFNAELVETRRRLRDVRFQLTEDIERLGSNLKLINTALIPAILTILMLVAYFTRTRRRKTAA